MPMRLQEVHPALVHFPLTLFPLAIGADLVGRATGRRDLSRLGEWGISAAAASGALAGIFGLIAQEEVNTEDPRALELLQTHRGINLTGAMAMTAMAVQRRGQREASSAYLAAGVGLLGALLYSAYLGGKMVYGEGLGVEPADGLYGEVPELTRRTAGRATRIAARDLGRGVVQTARDLAHGRIAPALWDGDGRAANGGESGGSGAA